jgi:hypothetical protein
VAKAFLFGLDAEADDFTAEADHLEQQQQSQQQSQQQYEEARAYWSKRGPVGKLHNLIKWIKASPQRLEAFRIAAKESHEAQGFRLSEDPTFELSLRQNNATRWNSTYLMIERAWRKRADIQAYLYQLEAEGDGPDEEDILTSGEWKLLGEIQQILEPIFRMTMETQGHGKKGNRPYLWEVMTGMEYIMEQLEDWKALYLDESAELATETAALSPLERPNAHCDPALPLGRSSPARTVRRGPSRQVRHPQLSQSRFNEAALLEHTRFEPFLPPLVNR